MTHYPEILNTRVEATPSNDNETNAMCLVVSTSSTSADDGTVRDSSTVIGTALGGVTAGLLLILVGVIMGWVLTCSRNKLSSKQQANYSAKCTQVQR